MRRMPALHVRSGATPMQPRDTEFPPSHCLAKHVHACASSGCVVFLDMNSGRYMTLQQAAAKSLSRYVAGWPIHDQAAEQGPSSSPGARRLLDQLAEKGLLTTNSQHHSTIERSALAVPAAAETLLDVIHMQEPDIRAHYAASFLLSSYRARALLRWHGLRRVIERVRKKKAALATAAQRSDPERTRALTSIFNRLQPLALDGRDGCLLQSFSQLEFLLYHGVTAEWVFGVRATPFAAHCWLQQGNVLLNDFPQRVCYLSPIMVV